MFNLLCAFYAKASFYGIASGAENSDYPGRIDRLSDHIGRHHTQKQIQITGGLPFVIARFMELCILLFYVNRFKPEVKVRWRYVIHTDPVLCAIPKPTTIESCLAACTTELAATTA